VLSKKGKDSGSGRKLASPWNEAPFQEDTGSWMRVPQVSNGKDESQLLPSRKLQCLVSAFFAPNHNGHN